MEWQNGMNEVVDYIEKNLHKEINYDIMARMLGCSVYEFSRVFSFVTGVTISEYIKRRRLSVAAIELQTDSEKIIDIALKYGYESHSSFTRAFSNLHGVSPKEVKNKGVSIKSYPKIHFIITIKGVNEMVFRVEEKESFEIIGFKGMSTNEFDEGDTLDKLWRKFMDKYDVILWNNGDSYYNAPFWQVAAYDFMADGGDTETIIGAELGNKEIIEGLEVKRIPQSKWVVFSITSPTGGNNVSEAYTRVITEWLPQSGYKRNETVPNLEVFPPGDASSNNYLWEIWLPVL